MQEKIFIKNNNNKKIVLFGGAEVGEVETELKQIEKVIKRLKPKQIFHIPFARTKTAEPEWAGDWFHRNINLKNIDYLNAKNNADKKKVKNPLIFISGGSNNINLKRKLEASPQLLKLIKKAYCIIGESAGAKILGEYFRAKGNDENSKMMKGLNIIKDAVIEPHYTQRKRQKLLIKDMCETGVKYGIGIDSCTAIEFNINKFPKKYKKIGKGLVKIISS